MKKIIRKIIQQILAIPVSGIFGELYNYINIKGYMKYKLKFLKSLGIKIEGIPKYISSNVYFDGSDYTKIQIGDNITISREVMFLTHDYSLTTAVASLGRRIERGMGELSQIRIIKIGDNCFIGARTTILGGSNIGDNCIIGACTVIRGNIPSNSVVYGNPSKVLCDTRDYAERHLKSGDYLIEN